MTSGVVQYLPSRELGVGPVPTPLFLARFWALAHPAMAIDGRRLWLGAAGLAGTVGVMLAASAAHLADSAARPDIDLAARFLLFHALALLGIAALIRTGARWLHAAGGLFVLGSACFAGGLCLTALVDHRLVPLVPVGGTLLILGWLALVAAAISRRG
jgi:uncharacterized membrane protein YgdD (TMEM256/DUF423 family)